MCGRFTRLYGWGRSWNSLHCHRMLNPYLYWSTYAFIWYLKNWEHKGAVNQLRMDLKCLVCIYLVGVLCNIPIVFGIPKGTLRRIFWPLGEQVAEGWRKAYEVELQELYWSQNFVRVVKLRRMAWPGHEARRAKKRNVYRMFTGKPEGERPFGRLSPRLKGNIKIDLKEIVWEVTKWNSLA